MQEQKQKKLSCYTAVHTKDKIQKLKVQTLQEKVCGSQSSENDAGVQP
jgi:predicted transcriptional regulator